MAGSTYPSDDPELVAVEAGYAAKEAVLQAEIDNIESCLLYTSNPYFNTWYQTF